MSRCPTRTSTTRATRSSQPRLAGSFDLVIVLTDHAVFDWGLIHENAEQILDTRNVYPQGADKVHKL